MGYAFLMIFVLEAALKVIGMGFIHHKNSYLRDGWNWLDFIIVILGLTDWVLSSAYPSMPSMKSLRTLRVLRPLRTLNTVPSMKRLIKTLLLSLPDLVHVALFMTFFLMVFGILGVQLFCGYSYYFCRLTPEPVNGKWEIDPNQSNLCSKDGTGRYTCNAGTYCGAPQDFNLDIKIDDPNSNPNIFFGLMTFDNLGRAILTIFQVISLSDWNYIMYNYMNSNNQFIAVGYFFMVVIFGSFFILNLIMAVIMISFEKIDKQVKISKEKKVLISKQDSVSNLSDINILKINKHNNDYTPKVGAQDDPIINAQQDKSIQKHDKRMIDESFGSNKEKINKHKKSKTKTDKNQIVPKVSDISSISIKQQLKINKPIKNQLQVDKNDVQNSEQQDEQLFSSRTQNQLKQEEISNFNIQSPQEQYNLGQKIDEDQNINNEFEENDQTKKEDENLNIQLDTTVKKQIFDQDQLSISINNLNNGQIDMDNFTMRDYDNLNIIDLSFTKYPYRTRINRIYRFFFQLCTHPVFNIIAFCSILLNTIILSLDRYPIQQYQSNLFDKINQFLTWVFLFEMICKLIAFGPKVYFIDKFNRFDCLVVIVSIVEIIYDLSTTSTQSKGVSAFRAFRLLRIFKLARNWKSFQVMLFKIGVTIKDIANYSILLVIVMFTYSLLGLEFFANQIKMDIQGQMDVINDGPLDYVNGIPPRTNFDNFWSSMVTVFILLMGDGWDNVMYDYMRIYGVQAGVVLYFVSLIVIGNMILIRLFAAILLKNFEDEEEEVKNEQLENQQAQKGKIYKFFSKTKSFLSSLVNKEKLVTRKKSMKINQDDKSFINNLQNEEGVEIYDLNKDQQISSVNNEQELDSEQVQEQAKSNSILQKDIRDKLANGLSNSLKVQQKVSNLTLDPQNMIQTGIYAGIKNILDKKQVEAKSSVFMKKVQEYEQNANKPKDIFSLIMQAMKQNEIKKKEQSLKYGGNQILRNIKSHEANQENTTNQKEFQTEQKEENNQQSINNSNSVQPISNNQASYKASRADQISQLSAKLQSKIIKLHGKSLWIFGPHNKIRFITAKLISAKHFDNVILLIILLSSIQLIIENPLQNPNSTIVVAAEIFDKIITVIFFLEMFCKVVVFGFILNGKDSYLRNGWNVLDIIIVAISVISYFITGSRNFKTLKVLRLLRVLRPLRMISRNEGLKICVKSLIQSLPGIFNVLVLSMIFLMIFGIFFTNLLKGKFFHCYLSDDVKANIGVNIKSIYHKWDCLSFGGEWLDSQNNFNNLLMSMYSLFAIATTDNWAVTLFNGIDATDINYQPQLDNSYWMAIIFVFYTVFGFLFMLNLFMEVVVNTFNKEKYDIENHDLLTDSQKEWVQIQLLCLNCRPLKKRIATSSKFRNYCIYTVESKYFEGFILFNIVCNTFVLTLFWVNISTSVTNVLEQINYVFVGVFTIEAVLKLIAYGPKFYFQSGWNIFDFIVVLGAWIGVVLKFATKVQVIAETTLIRTFRICRALRLIKKAKSLNAIFNALVITLPALGNLGCLLLLFIYLYAVLGINLFASLQLQDNVNLDVNFQSFGYAFLALFRVSTGDNWQFLMYDCLLQSTLITPCIDDPTYDDYVNNGYKTVGCGTPYARVYFISFTIVVTYIFVNLFLAIIIQGFAETTERVNYKITDSEIETFQDVWSEFDPNGSGFININELSKLIRKLIAVGWPLIPQGQLLCELDDEMDAYIDYLALRSCNNFTNYHFTDIVNAISVNNEEESNKIKRECLDKYGKDISDVDDMLNLLNERADNKKIAMCQLLNSKMNNIHVKLEKNSDKFEGNYYDSRHILRMTKIQKRLKEMFLSAKQKVEERHQTTSQQEQITTEQKKQQETIEKQQSIIIKEQQQEEEQQQLIINNPRLGSILPDINQKSNQMIQYTELYNNNFDNKSNEGEDQFTNRNQIIGEVFNSTSSLFIPNNQSPQINFYVSKNNNVIQDQEESQGLISNLDKSMEEEKQLQASWDYAGYENKVNNLIKQNLLFNNEESKQQEELKQNQEFFQNLKRNDLSQIDEEKEIKSEIKSGWLENQNQTMPLEDQKDKNNVLEEIYIKDFRAVDMEQPTSQRQMSQNQNQNTPGRGRKPLQPQQNYRKQRQPQQINQNQQQRTAQNVQTISDGSIGSRIVYINHQIQPNANISENRIQQENLHDSYNNMQERHVRSNSIGGSQHRKSPLRKIILYNLDQKQFETYVDLIDEISKKQSFNDLINKRDNLNLNVKAKSSDNSLQIVSDRQIEYNSQYSQKDFSKTHIIKDQFNNSKGEKIIINSQQQSVSHEQNLRYNSNNVTPKNMLQELQSEINDKEQKQKNGKMNISNNMYSQQNLLDPDQFIMPKQRQSDQLMVTRQQQMSLKAHSSLIPSVIMTESDQIISVKKNPQNIKMKK